MATGAPHLRKVYKTVKQQTSFYTGGQIRIGGNNQSLTFCISGDVINVVEIKSGTILHTLKGDEQSITSIDVHPKTDDILFSTLSRLMYHLTRNEFYESQISEPSYNELPDEEKSLITPWKVQRKWKSHERPVIDICFDSTGTFCATGSADRTAKVWNLQQGFCTHNFKGHTGVVSLVRFHPDPNKLQLFTASDDCSIRVWDLVTKSSIVLSSHMSQVTSLVFPKSGWELISAGRDRVLTVWDLHNGKVVKTIPVFEAVESIALIDNGKSKLLENKQDNFVITAGDKGVLRVWNTKSGECVCSETEDFKTQYLQFIAFKNESNTFAAVNADQNILIYNFDKNFNREKIICGYNDEILDIKYTNGGTHIAVATNSERVKLYDLETLNCQVFIGHEDTVVCIDTNRDGSLIVTSSKDNSVRVWDTTTLRCLAVCQGHTESVGAVCFSKKSNHFVLSGSQDKTLKVWDIKDATKFLDKNIPLPNDFETVSCKSISTIRAHDKDINAIAIAPNDTIIATGSQDATVKLWDKKNVSLISTLRGHKRGVWCIAFSPYEHCIASASADHTIKIWSLVDYTCLKTFEGHGNSVLKVAFISLGLQLLSCGSDGVVKLWNIKNNECVNTFDNHEDRIWSLAIKNDGDEFVSGGSDSLINFWKDYTEIEEEEAAKLKEQKIQQEQQLSNFLREKQYKRAIMIAFELDQPNRIYNLFDELADSQDFKEIDSILSEIPRNHLVKCLFYIRDWNTIAKQSQLAHVVLNRILHLYPPEELSKLPNIKEILVALMSYSERHFQRLDSLLQKSYIVDYAIQQMKIAPQLPESMIANVDQQKIEYLKRDIESTKAQNGADHDDDDAIIEDNEESIIITGDVEEETVKVEDDKKHEKTEKKTKSPKAKLLKNKLTQKRKSVGSPHNQLHKKKKAKLN